MTTIYHVMIRTVRYTRISSYHRNVPCIYNKDGGCVCVPRRWFVISRFHLVLLAGALAVPLEQKMRNLVGPLSLRAGALFPSLPSIPQFNR